eukprot:2949995-Prymnesium_polylepis.1
MAMRPSARRPPGRRRAGKTFPKAKRSAWIPEPPARDFPPNHRNVMTVQNFTPPRGVIQSISNQRSCVGAQWLRVLLCAAVVVRTYALRVSIRTRHPTRTGRAAGALVQHRAAR